MGRIYVAIFVIFVIFWIISLFNEPSSPIRKESLPEEERLTFEELVERYQLEFSDFLNRQTLSDFSWTYSVDNKTMSWIEIITRRHFQSNRSNEYYSNWIRKDLPFDLKKYSEYVRSEIEKREKDLIIQKRNKDAEIAKEKRNSEIASHEKFAQEFMARDIVESFFEISYRKVKSLDEYGDEQWDKFDEEFERILKKTNLIDVEEGEKSVLRTLLLNKFKEYILEKDKNKLGINNFSSLSGVDFENFIVKDLKEKGFEKVSGTKASGDQGADVLFEYDGVKYVIQSKRWKSKVGNKAIQEVHSAVVFYNRDVGIAVTTSAFTPSARELAIKVGVILIEGSELHMIEDIIKKNNKKA